MYDDYRSDAVVDQIPLDEDAVLMCLDELVYSDFGKQMFGVHDGPGTSNFLKKGNDKWWIL